MTLTTTIIGRNPHAIWGISVEERTRRLTRAARQQWLGVDADGADILINAAFFFDPLWFAHIGSQPGTVLVERGVPVIAHVADPAQAQLVAAAMRADAPLAPGSGLHVLAIEDGPTIESTQLRKRVTPFLGRLVPESRRALERASYYGAYKGVTDLLTKYLWPEAALVLTRIAARLGVSPNQVTTVGFALCILATVLFWYGQYWWGMAAGLVFMVLDTVDGKLARCTVTSSKWGNIFDHGIDIVHPPFWWYAWGVGLAHWDLALPQRTFAAVMVAVLGGYAVQRLIEGVFMRRNGMMHIHVWRRVDSRFRLITARRNPNMVILFVATLARRPDIGLVAVGWWTVLSCAIHLVRLTQSELLRARGGAIRSWLSEESAA